MNNSEQKRLPWIVRNCRRKDSLKCQKGLGVSCLTQERKNSLRSKMEVMVDYTRNFRNLVYTSFCSFPASSCEAFLSSSWWNMYLLPIHMKPIIFYSDCRKGFEVSLPPLHLRGEKRDTSFSNERISRFLL